LKISIIGGGSYLWTFGFVRQFVKSERLQGAEIVLMDIDKEALDLVGAATRLFNTQHGSPIKLTTTTDHDVAFDAADYVLACISTGALDSMRFDLEIPEKYGIYHPVGDTVGPGGWMRAVRNIPVFHDFAERAKRLCPNAWFINMTNPLTPLTRIPHRDFGLKVIGMCPGIQETVAELAMLAGVDPSAPKDYVNTGIDHGAWFTELHAGNVDVLAKLKELGFCESDDAEFMHGKPREEWPAEAASMRALFAVWREIGYIPSIRDRHCTENWPWFLNVQPDPLPYGIVRTFIGERQEGRVDRKEALGRYVQTEDDSILGELGHGDDPICTIIECLEGYGSFMWSANMPNVGQIPGFPDGAVVETRCRFDSAGVHPMASPMPNILKTIVLPQVLRQEEILDIALTGAFDDLVALMTTDPLCSRLPMGKVREMVREMVTAEKQWIQNKRLLEF
jgi:alpha-galactosidase/6-phospho-beta-glucosidase family protein